jgi:RimJ/RimL family protein N-acetyltransferase
VVRLAVPDLRDDVVALRPPVPGDADAVAAAVQDPDIPRFTMVPSPYTTADAVAWIARTAVDWRIGRTASFVIVDAGTGGLLGSVGLQDLDERVGRAVAGYWVDAAARGRGVATRALRLVADWALDPAGLGLRRVDLQVFTDNPRSGRVAERAGFVSRGVAPEPVAHPSGPRRVVAYSRAAPRGRA